MCYVRFTAALDGGMLVSQMSRWRGGQQGKGGGGGTAKGIELRGGGIGSRPGSTYSLPGPQVCCAGRVVSVWSGEHVRTCVLYLVILVILL